MDPQKQEDEPYVVGPGKPPKDFQYKPGQSGNPGGRPKGSSILAPILRKLAEKENEHGEGARAVILAERAIKGAAAGEDISAVLKLMERTDPVVKESKVHLFGDNGAVPMEADSP